MNYVESYSKQNAVKVIAFDVKLAKNISVEEMNILIDSHSKSSDYKSTPQQQVSMTIGPDGVSQQVIQNSGVVLETGSWKITINKEQVSITCAAYSRWHTIFPEAIRYFKEVFSQVDSSVSHIILEYHDEFNVLNSKEAWLNELFAKDCNYLTPDIYTLNSFWHVHYGYFTSNDKFDNDLLDNIRINFFADEKDSLKEKVNIVTQHVLAYQTEQKLEDITNDFNEIHIHSKQIFEQILNDDILKEFEGGKSD